MVEKSVHVLIPRTRGYVKLHSKRDFADVSKFMNLKIGRLVSLIQVDQIETRKPLKAENFLHLEQKTNAKRGRQRDSKLRRISHTVAGLRRRGQCDAGSISY